ncbi:kinetochore NDC80, partial [Fusarium mexicanum]
MKRSSSNIGGNYPGSHVRSMSGSRQSLAMQRPNQPLFQRSSSGTNLADLGLSSVKRSSFAPKASAFTPNPTTRASTDGDRRSSVYRPRQSTAPATTHHQSFFQTTPAPAGVP